MGYGLAFKFDGGGGEAGGVPGFGVEDVVRRSAVGLGY